MLTEAIERLSKGKQTEASFCVWQREKATTNQKDRHDPNYSYQKDFVSCPFHQGLHKFI
jgi:hypothetical protein